MIPFEQDFGRTSTSDTEGMLAVLLATVVRLRKSSLAWAAFRGKETSAKFGFKNRAE